jgi:hypothetical protein
MKSAASVVMFGIAMMVLSAPAAEAQMGGGHHRRGGDQKAASKAPKVDQKAYDAALKTIPDSKEKFDPWGSLGVSSQAKKPK